MSQWIKVSERLPDEWGMYLVAYYRPLLKRIDMQVIHFDNERNKFNVEFTDDEPRYWQFLPELPHEND